LEHDPKKAGYRFFEKIMLDQKAGARSRFHSKRTRFSEPFSKSMKFTGFAASLFFDAVLHFDRRILVMMIRGVFTNRAFR
jgi:hypothetical protein